ncbi:MAG: oligosaccharide flippase family protein [Candidatus Dormibacteria bacterium]
MASVPGIPGPAGNPGDPAAPADSALPGAPPQLSLRSRAVRGVAALLVRQVLVRLLTLAGNIALARLLAPRDFGVYAVVTFIVNSLALLTDVGLGAALIRNHAEPTLEEMRSVFLVQQALVATVVVALWVLAEPILRLYRGGFPPSAPWMLRVMALTLLVGSLGSISSVLLERRLEFQRRAMADLAQGVIFVVAAVGLAYEHWGPWSFIAAAGLGGAVSTGFLFALAPWRLGWAFHPDSIRSMVRFGLPYQGASLLGVVKDNIPPLLVAPLAGAAALGYINLAQTLAYMPLILISIVGRVTFPAFSRMQHRPEQLRRALEISVRWISLGVFPAVLLLVALAPQVIHFIYTPRTEPAKWDPAIIPIYLFAMPAIFSTYSTVFITALYALGRAGFMLRLTLLFTVAGWGLSLPLVLLMPDHYLGYPVAMALITPLSVLAVREVRQVVQPDFVGWTVLILAAASAAALLTWWLGHQFAHNLFTLVAVAAVGLVAYVAMLAAVRGRFLWAEGRELVGALRG